MKENFEMVAKTFFGLEEVLANELKGIGATNIEIQNRAVSFYGDLALMYKANLHLRTALNVLLPIAKFKVFDAETLYENTKKIEWDKYLDINNTFSVNVVSSSVFKHTGFAALKTKDAIVDFFREKVNERPSVDTVFPDIKINVYVYRDDCTISLDTSGEPLFKRGYRESGSTAPLNEVLAAGMILLSGWEKDGNFIDFMCGSGTLPIEAAMIAHNIPPNIFRNEFSFERWKNFDADIWEEILDETSDIKLSESTFDFQIMGSDISKVRIGVSKENLNRTILRNYISFKANHFEKMTMPKGKGIIIINPPYDERLKERSIEFLYERIGDYLKKNCENYDVWILSGNTDAIKRIGLRTSRKLTLFNGGIECKFLKYEMYKGSKKEKKQEPIEKI